MPAPISRAASSVIAVRSAPNSGRPAPSTTGTSVSVSSSSRSAEIAERMSAPPSMWTSRAPAARRASPTSSSMAPLTRRTDALGASLEWREGVLCAGSVAWQPVELVVRAGDKPVERGREKGANAWHQSTGSCAAGYRARGPQSAPKAPPPAGRTFASGGRLRSKTVVRKRRSPHRSTGRGARER